LCTLMQMTAFFCVRFQKKIFFLFWSKTIVLFWNKRIFLFGRKKNLSFWNENTCIFCNERNFWFLNEKAIPPWHKKTFLFWNDLKARSVLVSSRNSKDTCANHVRPHASTGMRPCIPNLEFMRAPQFLKYCIVF